MALKHLNKTQKGNLVIYDRGYLAVCFYKYHRLKNVDFPCTEKSLSRCRKDKISTDSLRLRLVRVDPPPDEPEVLVSSLTDLKVYPTSIFTNLYHQRWGVEEDHKVLKSSSIFRIILVFPLQVFYTTYTLNY